MRTAGLTTNQTVRLQKIERIALAVGLTLIAVWAVAQIQRFAVSRASIAHFRAQNPDAISGSVDPAVGSLVDFRLWSTNRVAAYKQSLIEKTMAAKANHSFLTKQRAFPTTPIGREIGNVYPFPPDTRSERGI